MDSTYREGGLDKPTRYPIDWKNPDFYDPDTLFAELERVYDICHSCRRCVSLCNAFPSLFDLIDNSDTFEIDGVSKNDYWQVVEDCYLCDLCYMTKCPYVPPHDWNVDFPHLMLRAKAQRYKAGKGRLRDKVLASTDNVGKWLGIPIVAQMVNAGNQNRLLRKTTDKLIGIHPQAQLPKLNSQSLHKKWLKDSKSQPEITTTPTVGTTGKIALFASCYGHYYEQQQVQDLIKVLNHNNLEVTLLSKDKCCGMPKFELGDLEGVVKLFKANMPVMLEAISQGFDLLAPIPSCVLMFKQELPLLLSDMPEAKKIAKAFFDPFEYLMLRHKAKKLNLSFEYGLGKVLYHVPCHQRVQNIGSKTKEVLALIPKTEITMIERCSGHNGTYAIKSEKHQIARKICRPIISEVKKNTYDYYTSDCPMAATHIIHCSDADLAATSPFTLLRTAYQI